jgi:prepilin-type N-terminal cleavage/methylation domain-containing protein
MIMSKKCRNQQGFTLIEVLLSIILLFIILTSFIGFFTQSALFSNKNEQKFGTMQTAQKVINLIEMDVTKQILQNDLIVDSAGNVINGIHNLSKSQIENYIDDTIDPNFDASAVLTNNSSENLIQVKLTIKDLKNPGNISETYTYIRR